MNCIIIDDEPLAGQLLEAYCQRTPDLNCLRQFNNPLEALAFLGTEPTDLIFLDIQMPELTGMQLLEITKGKYPVILTTAYEQYATKSYEFDVIDYLLKPISLDRFMLAVEKAKQRLATKPNATANPTGTVNSPQHLFVKSGTRTVRVDLSDIIRLESLDNYVCIFTTTEKIMTLENLGDFEESLPENAFARVHRSHIVALRKIDYIEKNRVVMGKDYIPISAKYKEEFWGKL